jgi:threonine synthase
MHYVSTRGQSAPKSFTEVLLSGLADDGGLYMPSMYPRLSESTLEKLRGASYAEVAFAVLREYCDDIPPDDLMAIIADAYGPKVFPEEVVPVQELEPGLHLMKLSEGPTLAFKDLALQLVGALMSYALSKKGGELNILGATSGDTGSAAAYSLKGRTNMRLFMLSPKDRMSAFQRAQMYSLNEPNIFNLVVDGTFDDCQAIVKAVNEYKDFKACYYIGAMNSINWARIAAQVVYSVYAYLAVAGYVGEKVMFAIPSGNFGNAFSVYVAAKMGLPIEKIIVATNENDVLDVFFRTRTYNVQKGRSVRVTSSPSMDILSASNLERLIFEMVGRDSERLSSLWADLGRRSYLSVDWSENAQKENNPDIVSGMATQEDVIATITATYERYKKVIDPHTAVAMTVGCLYRKKGLPLIIAETAQPAKFGDTIKEALGFYPPSPFGYEGLENLQEYVTHIPADPEAVMDFIREHV